MTDRNKKMVSIYRSTPRYITTKRVITNIVYQLDSGFSRWAQYCPTTQKEGFIQITLPRAFDQRF